MSAALSCCPPAGRGDGHAGQDTDPRDDRDEQHRRSVGPVAQPAMGGSERCHVCGASSVRTETRLDRAAIPCRLPVRPLVRTDRAISSSCGDAGSAGDGEEAAEQQQGERGGGEEHQQLAVPVPDGVARRRAGRTGPADRGSARPGHRGCVPSTLHRPDRKTRRGSAGPPRCAGAARRPPGCGRRRRRAARHPRRTAYADQPTSRGSARSRSKANSAAPIRGASAPSLGVRSRTCSRQAPSALELSRLRIWAAAAR